MSLPGFGKATCQQMQTSGRENADILPDTFRQIGVTSMSFQQHPWAEYNHVVVAQTGERALCEAFAPAHMIMSLELRSG